ncbi:hypothetical protein M0R45_006500 [Rubus argutus]|uniref:Uncharacterized protein n=1 Tax=Rubus argutus TaxID=59490 RepID=A0AAW1YR73_RUBAR
MTGAAGSASFWPFLDGFHCGDMANRASSAKLSPEPLAPSSTPSVPVSPVLLDRRDLPSAVLTPSHLQFCRLTSPLLCSIHSPHHDLVPLSIVDAGNDLLTSHRRCCLISLLSDHRTLVTRIRFRQSPSTNQAQLQLASPTP